MALQPIKRWKPVALAAVLKVATVTSVARADTRPFYQWSPSQGVLMGQDSSSFPGLRELTGNIMGETAGGASTCFSDRYRLYAFCNAPSHEVFEHEIWLHNYRDFVTAPYSFAWADTLIGYASNLPGSNYLDTRASDPPNELSFTVGTIDAQQLQVNVWYYSTVYAEPDAPGPNWYKLAFQMGNRDAPDCGITVEPAWCMLSPHVTEVRIPFENHYTMPGFHYWYGPYAP